MCKPRITAATVCDHITPHKGDLTKFWNAGNLQSLCKPCHDGAKQQLEKTGKLRGCDEQGIPFGIA
jgi:5-methylcytosine-specific restriction endonuclease McrA